MASKYKEPRWVKSIPKGSHGTKSNPITFRYWKLVSDYTRIHDFYKYKGKCISCDRILEHWSEGQAAHFRSFGQSNSWAKYSLANVALSCPHCNHIDDSYIGHKFGEELKARKGKSIIKNIDNYNNEQRGKKMQAWEIEKKMLELINMIENLPEQPDYISTAKSYM